MKCSTAALALAVALFGPPPGCGAATSVATDDSTLEPPEDVEELAAERDDLRAQLATKNQEFLLQHSKADKLAAKVVALKRQLSEEVHKEHALREKLDRVRVVLESDGEDAVASGLESDGEGVFVSDSERRQDGTAAAPAEAHTLTTAVAATPEHKSAAAPEGRGAAAVPAATPAVLAVEGKTGGAAVPAAMPAAPTAESKPGASRADSSGTATASRALAAPAMNRSGARDGEHTARQAPSGLQRAELGGPLPPAGAAPTRTVPITGKPHVAKSSELTRVPLTREAVGAGHAVPTHVHLVRSSWSKGQPHEAQVASSNRSSAAVPVHVHLDHAELRGRSHSPAGVADGIADSRSSPPRAMRPRHSGPASRATLMAKLQKQVTQLAQTSSPRGDALLAQASLSSGSDGTDIDYSNVSVFPPSARGKHLRHAVGTGDNAEALPTLGEQNSTGVTAGADFDELENQLHEEDRKIDELDRESQDDGAGMIDSTTLQGEAVGASLDPTQGDASTVPADGGAPGDSAVLVSDSQSADDALFFSQLSKV